MVPRIFDPGVFRGQGALMDFDVLIRPHLNSRLSAANDLKYFHNMARAVFLRWQLNPRIGMPSEPFKVWRRPAYPLLREAAVPYHSVNLPPLGNVLIFDQPMVSFSGVLQGGPTAQRVTVVPLADGVGFDNMLGLLTFDLAPNASRSVTFQAPYMTAVLLIGTHSLNALTGVPASAATKIAGWELVETVGLPVEEAEWTSLPGQSHGEKQGLVSSPLSAKQAAADRYQRGVNPFGWHPLFPDGRQAPKWELPLAKDLVKEAHAELLPVLRDALVRPPAEQGAYSQSYLIHPPENAVGDTMQGADGKADLAPLTLLQMAASTDPLLAVILGFGTGFAHQDIPTMTFSNRQLFGDKNMSHWDYMVTGLWAKGLDGESPPVEYAALIPRPRLALPPPAPGDVRLTELGLHQPDAPDYPWTAAVRVSWERFVLENLTRVASFAFARSDLDSTGPADALMERRTVASGHMPIGNLRSTDDPEPVRQSATDSGFPIPSEQGKVEARYGVATQNVFGIWSPWIIRPYTGQQPEPDRVQITDISLVPTDPGPPATVCHGRLQVDFVLDWRVRRIDTVRFRGRLFAATTRHDDPPAGFPVNLQTSLTGAQTAVVIHFAGDNPSTTGVGASIQSLDAQGEKPVAPGPATQGQSRRYRLTVEGFELDYAATPHIGLAVQARQTERIPPSRTSAWSPVTKVAYASDPRARSTTVTPFVPLASLPDANGECHGRLAWAPQPGAAGYVVYTSNELNLLDRIGQAAPSPGATLSERLTHLRQVFNVNSGRNAFSRVNEGLVTATSMDVSLPRGSQAIHCWIVLPVSAGGQEAPWPSGAGAADALLVYAAPRVAEPAPPTIEVRRVRVGAGFAAAVRVEPRGQSGAYPHRIDLYRTRVADAARRVDSMGYPIAELTASSGGWTVETTSSDSQGWISVVQGQDAPGGSWKMVWYRAVAWADPEPELGILGGRSTPSPAVPVVIPPEGPPPLGDLYQSWPGGGAGTIAIDFTTTAPLKTTPLGDHRLEVVVLETGVEEPLIQESLPLHEVPGTAPAAPGSGLWRESDGQYKLLIRRTDAHHPVSVMVRLTDPIGRSAEKTADIGSGSVLPVPTLSDISSFTMPGRGTYYSFTIDNALDDTIAGETYRVDIRLQKPGDLPGPVRPPFVLRDLPSARGLPGRPARVIPIPGPMRETGPERSSAQFRERGNTLSYSSSIADIPTIAPAETFAVSRQRIGQRVTIQVVARARIAAISVAITSPDGTRVSRRAKG